MTPEQQQRLEEIRSWDAEREAVDNDVFGDRRFLLSLLDAVVAERDAFKATCDELGDDVFRITAERDALAAKVERLRTTLLKSGEYLHDVFEMVQDDLDDRLEIQPLMDEIKDSAKDGA